MIDDKDSSDSTLRLILWKALQKYSTARLCALLSDNDTIVRTAAAKQLHLRGNKVVYRKALELCANENGELREIGAFLLGQLGTPKRPFRKQSISILVNLLVNDPFHEVRAAAAGALGHLQATEASNELLCIAGDSSPEVRACVAFALGTLKHSREIETTLRNLSQDENNEVREWAELSLEILEDKLPHRRVRRYSGRPVRR
jgi:HEAT repeat protein